MIRTYFLMFRYSVWDQLSATRDYLWFHTCNITTNYRLTCKKANSTGNDINCAWTLSRQWQRIQLSTIYSQPDYISPFLFARPTWQIRPRRRHKVNNNDHWLASKDFNFVSLVYIDLWLLSLGSPLVLVNLHFLDRRFSFGFQSQCLYCSSQQPSSNTKSQLFAFQLLPVFQWL